jgi:hypothetical protein
MLPCLLKEGDCYYESTGMYPSKEIIQRWE